MISRSNWAKDKLVEERTPTLLAGDTEAFESGIQQLLLELGGSHTVFYHESANQFLPQHTINASVRSFECSGSARWTFLDVYDDGPAHAVGIRPGDALIAVDGIACQPSVMPRFLLGQNIQADSAHTGRWRLPRRPSRGAGQRSDEIVKWGSILHAACASHREETSDIRYPSAERRGQICGMCESP
jgi:hypothetical protein